MINPADYCVRCGGTAEFRYADYLRDRTEEILAHSPGASGIGPSPDRILDRTVQILCSSRFSVYSGRMDPGVRRRMTGYLASCIAEGRPIRVVLAGMPGKCANREKVFRPEPDLGEFEVLVRLHLLRALIREVYPPGVKFTFLSDYLGLFYTFFPDRQEVLGYVEALRTRIRDLDLTETEILFLHEAAPETEAFARHYPDRLRAQPPRTLRGSEELRRSIGDNMNFDRGRRFYGRLLGEVPRREQVLSLAAGYYLDFWSSWNRQDYVTRAFGPVIYASPVAYHPDRRLCLRLQCSAARLAPWNGVAVLDRGRICSADERICRSRGMKPLLDSRGQLLAYEP